MQNDAIHTQNIVDVASFDGTAELDAEGVGRGRKLIFVFRKNIDKRYFKKGDKLK